MQDRQHKYLLFRLYGAMASWGGIAVGEFRPSQMQPTRSAVLGLLAAALGIRRDQESALHELSELATFAARLDLPGNSLRDYHTIQAPSSGKQVFRTRRDEVNQTKLNTILSSRDYRTDSGATIALQAHESAQNRVYEWQSALRQPALPLYLGRKSCPLALPTDPTVVEAAHFAEAFAQYPGCEQQLNIQTQIKPGLQVRFFWEGNDASLNGQVNMTAPQHDRLINRQRWQFLQRDEHQSSFSRHAEAEPNTESKEA